MSGEDGLKTMCLMCMKILAVGRRGNIYLTLALVVGPALLAVRSTSYSRLRTKFVRIVCIDTLFTSSKLGMSCLWGSL